jgi:hypothetical protein
MIRSLIIALSYDSLLSMFLGAMCELTTAARSRRIMKEAAETSAFKQWLDKRATKLEQSTRRKRVASSKFLSFFFDQVALHSQLQS